MAYASLTPKTISEENPRFSRKDHTAIVQTAFAECSLEEEVGVKSAYGKDESLDPTWLFY